MPIPLSSAVRYRILQGVFDHVFFQLNGTPQEALTAELSAEDAEFVRDAVDYLNSRIDDEIAPLPTDDEIAAELASDQSDMAAIRVALRNADRLAKLKAFGEN